MDSDKETNREVAGHTEKNREMYVRDITQRQENKYMVPLKDKSQRCNRQGKGVKTELGWTRGMKKRPEMD